MQLNIYGFHKTRHDEDSCEFKQPNFKRGMPHLVGLIRRKGQQGNNNASAAGSNSSTRHAEGNTSSKVIYMCTLLVCVYMHTSVVTGENRTEWVGIILHTYRTEMMRGKHKNNTTIILVHITTRSMLDTHHSYVLLLGPAPLLTSSLCFRFFSDMF